MNKKNRKRRDGILLAAQIFVKEKLDSFQFSVLSFQ